MTNHEVISMPLTGEITIRVACATDVNVIHEFISLLKEKTLDFKPFKDLYLQALSKTDNFYLVAVDNNTVVGFISCYEQILLHRMGKVFEIQELFVQEEYRRSGVGRMLVNAVEAAIASQPYASLEVSANTRRIKAHRFYLDCGFTQSHCKFTKSKTI